jgi:hypothetical protein
MRWQRSCPATTAARGVLPRGQARLLFTRETESTRSACLTRLVCRGDQHPSSCRAAIAFCGGFRRRRRGAAALEPTNAISSSGMFPAAWMGALNRFAYRAGRPRHCMISGRHRNHRAPLPTHWPPPVEVRCKASWQTALGARAQSNGNAELGRSRPITGSAWTVYAITLTARARSTAAAVITTSRRDPARAGPLGRRPRFTKAGLRGRPAPGFADFEVMQLGRVRRQSPSSAICWPRATA